MFSALGGVLGPVCSFLYSIWASLGSIFIVFYRSEAGLGTPFSPFLGKARKRSKKGEEQGTEMDAFSFEFQVFPENGQVRFDFAGASGLRFRPLLFLFWASIFALRFLRFFLRLFGSPLVLVFNGSASEAAPLNEFN